MSEDIQVQVQKLVDGILQKTGALTTLAMAKLLQAAGVQLEQVSIIPNSSLEGMKRRVAKTWKLDDATAESMVLKAFETHGIKVVSDEKFVEESTKPDADGVTSHLHGYDHKNEKDITEELRKNPAKSIKDDLAKHKPSNNEREDLH